MPSLFRLLVFLLLFGLAAPLAYSQVDARMLRYPDVSASHVTFVYAGDVWVAPKAGGTAQRLSSPRGEEMLPRFSPDGRHIAFSANYDGNTDVYVVPSRGGDATRLTYHPMTDRVVDWTPDGEVLFASSRKSGRQRFNQFYRIDRDGGLPQQLPVPYGEFGAVSPDGGTLAFTTLDRTFRTWKRYRGGTAPDIWLFDLESYEATNITDNDANDSFPMWHGTTLYFLSDRGPNLRANLWATDTETGETRQVTDFADFDVTFPAMGPSDIVFEAGGRLYLLDLATETSREIAIDVATDRAARKPRTVDVSGLIQNGQISPSGKRALFEARGEIFTVPAEHGPIRALTQSSGSAERYPAWSPDGEHVAFFSDATGEYELTIVPATGGEPRTVTDLGPGYRYQPYWSPDSRKIAFIDQAMKIWVHDLDADRTTEVDQGFYMFHGPLSAFTVSWSPDSRWLAYDRGLDSRLEAAFLYDTERGERHQVTSGYYNASSPTFGPDGQYLYYLSNQAFSPVYSDLDNSFVYPNTTRLVAVPLQADAPSPLAPRNDVEEVESEEEDNSDAEEDGEEEDGTEAVEIDLEGLEMRAVVLPPDAGNYGNLRAASGKLVYNRYPRSGSGENGAAIVYYDLEAREEKTVMENGGAFELSHDGEKLLVIANGQWGIVSLAPDQSVDTPLRTGELETVLDPVAEWRQIFNDAWRLERDYFYDTGLHGVDWNAMRTRYGALVEDAATRWDVNQVLGDLIGELDASHTYRGGGDTEDTEQRNAGLLGVDWEIADGAYRIAQIIEGAPWDAEVRSPLRQPGVDVQEGTYVLAVNGRPLDAETSPWAVFDGLAGEAVLLTVNDRPTQSGAREVLIETLTPQQETRLRHLAWIEANRQRVDEASGGRVGYIYVRSTGIDGQNELVRQFTAQYTKDALIIDERFNSGGQIPDRFIELLDRDPLAYWAVRDGKDWQWPPVAHFGPKVMLINGWSGSGGDAFPDYFRRAELGPLVGERTWGGLIGISGAPSLVDGGVVTAPTFRMYTPGGEWFKEGYGVDPDVEVVGDPGELARGRDPQLEAGIEIALRQLQEQPYVRPARPAREDRVAPGR